MNVTGQFKYDKSSNISPVMQQWFHLKKQYPECALLFRVGDFYEFFFNDAEKMSQELDLKLTSRGYDDESGPVPLAGIPVKALNEYLVKIIEKGIPVAVAEQSEKPEKVGSKEFFIREVTQIITPGTVQDLSLLPSKANNYLASIHLSPKSDSSVNVWGLAIIDISTGEFSVSEYESQDILLNHLYRSHPVEFILSPSISSNEPNFRVTLEKFFDKVLIVDGDGFDFHFQNAYDILTNFYEIHDLDGYGLKGFTSGICAAGGLLAILKKRKVILTKKGLKVDSYNDFLMIDITARKNLELEQNQREGTVEGTLLWAIDQTHSPMGGRLLRQWLRQPLRDIHAINMRLDAVDSLVHELLVREDLETCLERLPDMERLAIKVNNRSLSPREALRLADGLRNLPKIIDILKSLKNITENGILTTITFSLHLLPDIITLIDSSIVDNPPTYLTDGNIIRSGFDAELDRLRNIKENGSQWLVDFETKEQERVNQAAKKAKTKEAKIKVAYTRGHGYYIEVRAGATVPEDYSISRSLKDRIRYITPDLQEMAEKILSAEEEIQEREEYIYKEKILNSLYDITNKIIQNADQIAILDVLVAFAKLASLYSYSRPEVTSNYDIQIKQGRHPVIERILPFGQFIPNDTNLNEESNLLIITGANMGGKSTYLRQVALLVILAQIGSFVPAQYAKVGIIDKIFTRVGVVDDLWHGQSHFMVEMVETANILNNATKHSLILLDEIGRGTSTDTGLAIATAVAEFIHSNIQAKTLFATHFHQLNLLEEQFPRIKNYHVAIEYEGTNLIFLHKVFEGGTDESYGIEVAQLAGFPLDVIEHARNLRTKIAHEKLLNGSYITDQNSDLNPVKKHSSETSFPIITPDEVKVQDQDLRKQMNKTSSKTRSLMTFMSSKEYEIIISELKNFDISKSTPLDALIKMQEWQKRLKELI